MKVEMRLMGIDLDIENGKKVRNANIANKMEGKLVKLPCTPTMEMMIDLYSFSDAFGFNEVEREIIEDDQYFYIGSIDILESHLLLWLSDKNPREVMYHEILYDFIEKIKTDKEIFPNI